MSMKMKLPALLLAAALAVAPLSGCTKKDGGGIEESASAMGRYVEENWELPIEASYITGLHKRTDGRIAMMLGTTEEGEQYYYSTSDGTDWQQDVPGWLEELLGIAGVVEIIHFNSRGEGAVAYYEIGDMTYTNKVAFVAADGTLRTTPIGDGGDPMLDDSYYETMELFRQAREGDEGDEDDEEGEPADAPDRVVVTRAFGAADPEAEDGDGDTGPDPEETPDQAEILQDGESQNEDEGVYSYGSSFYVYNLFMGEDGFIYIDTYNDFGKFDPQSGDLVQKYLQGGTFSTLVGSQVVQLMHPETAGYYGEVQPDGNTIYFMGDDGRPASEQQPVKFSGRNLRLFGGEDGALYMADMEGLYRLASGGESWEMIIDGALSSLSIPSYHLGGAVIHGGDQQEFLFYYSGDKPQLINCVYSPDTPTLPDTELTVYSLLNNYTLNQAVGVFRKKYPNVLVNIRTPNDGDGAMSGDEAIRALNTELLAGKGPDLFLLDNMPIDSYIEKEVLLDLSDIITPMVESGELYRNIAATLERDGGIYGMPTRISFPTLWGRKEAVAAADSLQALADWAEGNPALADADRDRMIFSFARANQNSFIGDDGRVDVDALEAFLLLLNRILPDKTVEELQDVESEESLAGVVSRVAVAATMEGFFDEDDYFHSDSLFGLVNETSDLVYGNLTGFASAMVPNGTVYASYGGVITYDAAGEYEYTSLPDDEIRDVMRTLPTAGGNVYYPSGLIGINAASDKVDLAKEFVLAMLSEDTQNIELYNGFPVSRTALEKRMQETMNIMSGYSYFDEETGNVQMIDMGYPSPGTRQAIAELIESLDTPVLTDQSLLELIIYESQSFFEGERSAGEAAQAVADGTRLQMEE